MVTKTFANFSTDTEKSFQLTIINDQIVELKERFDLIITASDPRVAIMEPLLLFIINDDESMCYMVSVKPYMCISPIDFSIGFTSTSYIINEGESITLMMEEKTGYVGGVINGGVPEQQLGGAFLASNQFEGMAEKS